MSKKKNKSGRSSARSYTVRIKPEESENITSFTVSENSVRYMVTCGVVGALLFVGACSLAALGVFRDTGEKEALDELRSVGRIQQEQLSRISSRLNNLQTEMDKLDRQEIELRQIVVAAGEPLPSPQRAAGGQGGAIGQQSMFKDLNWNISGLEQRLEARRKSVGQLEDVLRQRQKRLDREESILAGIPEGMPSDGDISSHFGLRWGGSDFHPGIDIADDYGTPVYATASGTVVFAGWNSGGYGNLVEIDHENGIETLYAHNEEILVREGQEVRKGEVIALMGSTGFSTGPHVHYEITVNGERVNPSHYY